jgi:hypothetical protein
VGSGYKTRVQQEVFVVPDRISFEVGARQTGRPEAKRLLQLLPGAGVFVDI